MEFKIDTKNSYVQITPVTNRLDANLTDALGKKCNELSQNIVVDLHNCLEADSTAFEGLQTLHEECYSNANSLVFTGINDEIMQLMKSANVAETINISPTIVEAVDIISMEILERDLFGEES